MTPRQTAMYFAEWGRARTWFRDHGVGVSQLDEKRHAIHRKSLGADKSSKDFTNADLDKVLGAFKAVYDGGNLNAQIRQIDQPEFRLNHLRARAIAVAESFVDREPGVMRRSNAENYIHGICRRMVFPVLGLCTEKQVGALVGALERTAAVRKRRAAVAAGAPVAGPAKEDDNGNPF